MDPTARFRSLVAGPDDRLPLDEAALLIAAHAHPDVDVDAELRRLDDLAGGCAEATLDGWRHHLFVHLGFRGDRETYHDPANSFLDEVVRRRTGIPISLSVLGMEVGRRLGVRLAGVSMPGHFLLRHQGEPHVFVDAFDGGRFLDEAGCEKVFREMHGPDVPFLRSYLEPVGPHAVLSRMLANLKAVYGLSGDATALGWVVELRLAIPGTPALERREVAHMMSARGRFVEAARQLEELAKALPEQSAALVAEAQALRARLN